ncbi:MAG TPA: polysaccharide biosynthesis C-terminal domain-containing protein [Dehalococcoidia bacterium]|nr:polysaccharide biosynthesis C-terminal domain-containing protein [Dehalococcoidia bacterium]
MSEQGAPAGEGGFLRNVNAVFLATVADYAVAFVTSIVVARTLGKAGLGAYSLFFLSAALTHQIVGLGIGNASIYMLGRRVFTLRQVVTAGQVMVVCAALVAAALAGVGVPVVGDALRERDVPTWAFVLAAPAMMEYRFLGFVLQGLGRFVAMSLVTLIDPLVFLLMLLAAIALADPGVGAAIWLRSAELALGAAVVLAVVGVRHVDLSRLLRPEREVIGRMVRFGAQGELGNLLQLANYRLDAYLVALFVGQAGVGLYAVAVGLSEGIWFIANSVAVVLVTQLTASDADDAAQRTPVVLRHTLLLSALGGAALAAAAPIFVRLLYGSAFSPAVIPLLWLLPGTVALAGSKVLTAYVFSQGRPFVNTMITAAAVVVTVALDLALIPALGVTGAAIASSAAYGAHFALALWAYGRLAGANPLRSLAPRRSDALLYLDALRAWARRSGPAPAAEGEA